MQVNLWEHLCVQSHMRLIAQELHACTRVHVCARLVPIASLCLAHMKCNHETARRQKRRKECAGAHACAPCPRRCCVACKPLAEVQCTGVGRHAPYTCAPYACASCACTAAAWPAGLIEKRRKVFGDVLRQHLPGGGYRAQSPDAGASGKEQVRRYTA